MKRNAAVDPRAGLAAEVWDLTLAWYAADGVQPACLGLQDRHGLGVSALFALAGMAAFGCPVLDEAGLAQALRRAEAWQRAVIEPLRAARRGVREVPLTDAIAESAEGLRRTLLQQEIEAERLQQALVCADYPVAEVGRDVRDATRLDSAAARVNAWRYVQRAVAAPTARDQADVEAILAPLTQGLRGDDRA